MCVFTDFTLVNPNDFFLLFLESKQIHCEMMIYLKILFSSISLKIILFKFLKMAVSLNNTRADLSDLTDLRWTRVGRPLLSLVNLLRQAQLVGLGFVHKRHLVAIMMLYGYLDKNNLHVWI